MHDGGDIFGKRSRKSIGVSRKSIFLSLETWRVINLRLYYI